MTGLDYETDRILEIAVSARQHPSRTSGADPLTLNINIQVIITNGNLEVVDDGLEFVIHAEKAVLDKFDCTLTAQRNESKKVTA